MHDDEHTCSRTINKMAALDVIGLLQENQGGFNFDLCKRFVVSLYMWNSFQLLFRNAMLEVKGFAAPKPMKTGTTIVGLIFKVFKVAREYIFDSSIFSASGWSCSGR